MGKRIIQQRRGKGSLTYRFPSHRYKAYIGYPSYSTDTLSGEVQKFIHSPGFSAPIVKIKLSSGQVFHNMAADNMFEGQSIMFGEGAKVIDGNILPLSKIPEGTSVFNIEVRQGDGGKFVRSAGGNAKVRKHLEGKVILRMPSKKEKTLDGRSRATIGIIAAAGKKDKPILKAGKRWHMKRARGKLYPRTSAVKMNAIDHPFGGGRGKVIGKPKTPPRYAPAGRKVGLLRARRTGRRKKK